MFRLLKITLISLLFYSCTGNLGPGALDGWDTVVFKTSEANLDQAIDSFYKRNPKYHEIKKWNYEADYWVKDHSYLKVAVFYFEDEPEEMYYVSFVETGYNKNPNHSRLAIRGVENGKGRWKQYNDFSPSDQLRIAKRFDDEVVKPLAEMLKTQTYIDKKYR